MESQTDLSRLSTRKLKSERKRLEKRRDALLVAFPDLGEGAASLTALYDTGRREENEWHRFAEVQQQIKAIKLELIRREQWNAFPNQGLAPTAPRKINSTSERESVVRPILTKKGMSIHDWAKKAGVDFHTADNYLKGKTNPYPATLKKLEDALGEKLPV